MSLTYHFPREEFEKHCLIFLPGREPAWHPPSRCLWTTSTEIFDRFAISAIYDDLPDVFVKHLGILRPDVGMYIDELLRLIDCNDEPSIPRVKALIKEINTWKPDKDSLAALTSSQLVPVKGIDGMVKLVDITEVFAIVDRRHYEDLFMTKIAFLDFDREAVHNLAPFICALGLEDRYTSRAIRESSKARDSVIDDKLTRNMREKAFALFRYGSPWPLMFT